MIQEWREFLKKRLPGYMIPSFFTILESFPLTPNGKIDRHSLPTPDGTKERSTGYVPPRTPTEEALARIWSEVLEVEKVGIEDNLFELGGDSILVIQIVSGPRKRG